MSRLIIADIEIVILPTEHLCNGRGNDTAIISRDMNVLLNHPLHVLVIVKLRGLSIEAVHQEFGFVTIRRTKVEELLPLIRLVRNRCVEIESHTIRPRSWSAAGFGVIGYIEPSPISVVSVPSCKNIKERRLARTIWTGENDKASSGR